MKRLFLLSFVLFLLSPFLGNSVNAQIETPPSCVITYPHTNAYYQEGSDMVIRVYSTGLGGTTISSIDKVEFFVDDTKIFETSEHDSNTYSFIWENLEAGSYRITARATNDRGVSFTSAGALVTVGSKPVVKRGISAGKGKYLANIISHLAPSQDFLQLWNGVTAENGSKWGTIERTQGVRNWTQSDLAYNVAEANNLSFRYHAIAWGSQYPSWIEALSDDVTAFRAAVESYIAAIAERYEYIDQIDVLNENLYLNTYNGQEHAKGSPYFRKGLGGPGETGYDWAVWLFEKTREYFPNSRLVMNDFELENNRPGINEMLDVIKVLRDHGIIDGFGTHAHSFNIDGMTHRTTALKNNLDLMAEGGVPIYATEYDMKGTSNNESSQKTSYENVFPVYWEHPAVAGITLWGYIEGRTWSQGTGIINANGSKRAALLWLEEYMENQPDVGYPHFGEIDNSVIINGEFDNKTYGWTFHTFGGSNATMEVVQNAGMSGENALMICPSSESPGPARRSVQLRQGVPIVGGKYYHLSFIAKADAPRSIDVLVQQHVGRAEIFFEKSINLTEEAQEFNFYFHEETTQSGAYLTFNLGAEAICVYLDKVGYEETDHATAINGYEDIKEQSKWTVSPNPFNNQIEIKNNLQENTNTTYKVFSSDGKLLTKGILNEQGEVYLNKLQKGIYFLQLENNKEVDVIKLIKN